MWCIPTDGNLSRLVDIVGDELAAMSHFRAELKTSSIAGGRIDGKGSSSAAEWHVLSRQHGAIRTNCMDCLDRTNVVQVCYHCVTAFGGHLWLITL
jgi:hypothetical protein